MSLKLHLPSFVMCLFLIQVCGGAVAASEDLGDGLADYRIDNQEWNGLSEFARIASTAGWQWRSVSSYPEALTDLATSADAEASTVPGGLRGSDRTAPAIPLETHGIVMLVYPLRAFEVAPLLRWVEAGGRLLLGDDFGESEELLSALGITRLLPEDNATGSALHLLHEDGSHPISNQAGTILTNHPAAFLNERKGLFPVPGSGYLLYDLTLGEGRVIALSDPSVLINAMLGAGDNRQLVENIARTLCDRAQCPALLLSGSAAADVELGQVLGVDETRSKFAADWKIDVETAVESFSGLELDGSSSKIVILVLALLSGFLLLSGFAVNRQRSVTSSPARDSSGGRRQRLVRQLSQHRHGGGNAHVSFRTAELLSQVFTDALRDEFTIDDDDDSSVWRTAIGKVRGQRRPLLASIIERLEASGLSGQSTGAGPSQLSSQLSSQRASHIEGKDFDEIVALMKRWSLARRGDDATSA